MRDNVLETRELTKNFPGQFAVNDVSPEIKRSTIHGLLGPNSTGKSTTLKLILDLLHPTKGEILSDGELWRREHLAKIGSLIEEPALHGDLAVEEDLLVHTKLLGVPKDKIYGVSETVDLENAGSKCTSRFSHGMEERLRITAALLNGPSLLILGEPTNGLDPVGIQEPRELIATFPKKRMTVIFSSHILSKAEQVVDEIDIVNKGQLMFQGTPNRGEDLEAFFMEVIKGGARRWMGYGLNY